MLTIKYLKGRLRNSRQLTEIAYANAKESVSYEALKNHTIAAANEAMIQNLKAISEVMGDELRNDLIARKGEAQEAIGRYVPGDKRMHEKVGEIRAYETVIALLNEMEDGK